MSRLALGSDHALPPGWQVASIASIAEHCLGKMLDRHKNVGTPRPYLRNLNVRWFDFDLSDLLEMRFEDEESERYQARRGDLIICEGGYPGRAAIWNSAEPIYLQKALHRVRFHEPARAPWVLYWLHYCDSAGLLHEHFSGAGIQHFTKAALARFSVPLPPLDEQKRIVAALDQAFAALDRARANAAANIADAEELLLRAAAQVFDDLLCEGKTMPLTEVAEHCLGKMLDKNKNSGRPRPYLRNINVRWFEVDQSDLLEMRIEDSEVERYSVVRGDLLICEGGYPGRAAIYDSDEPTFFQKALHRVRFKSVGLAKVVMYWLYVQSKTGALNEHFSGTGIQHFTGQALARFHVPVASESAMRDAAHRLDTLRIALDELSTELKRKQADITDLRQSLLQAAFSGQLS